MKSFAHTLLFFAACTLLTLFSNNLKATNIMASNEEALINVEKALNSYFNPSYFSIQGLSFTDAEGGGKSGEGTVSFFDVPGVKLNVLLGSNNKLKMVTALFPPEAKFEPIKVMNKIMDAMQLRESLPQTFFDGSQINIKSFELKLDSSGTAYEQFTATLATDAWDFMDFGSLKMQTVEFLIHVNKGKNVNEKPSLSGEIKGHLLVANSKIGLSSTIVANKEDLVFKGESNSPIKLETLLMMCGGEALKNDFLSLCPAPFVSLLEIPAFSFSAHPGARKFSVVSKGSTGQLSFDVEKATEGKYKYFLSYLPPVDYKLEKIDPSLKIIDEFNILKELKITVTNDPLKRNQIVKNAPPAIILEAKLQSTPYLNDLLQGSQSGNTAMPNLVFTGSLDKEKNIFLSVDANMNIELGSGWVFENVDVAMDYKTGARSPEMQLNGSLVMPIDNTKLRLRLGLNSEPIAATLGGKFTLESINDNSELKEWREPFGIPYVTFVNIGGQVAISGSTVIDRVGIIGNIKLGKMPSGGIDRRISGDVDALIDVDVAQSRISADIKNMNFLRMIEAFNDVDFSGSVADFLNTGINNAVVAIDPSSKSIKIKGDAVFFNTINGTVDIDANKTSVNAKGSLDKVSLDVAGMNILSITASNNENAGANFTVQTNSPPSVLINGKVKVFGITASESDMLINSNGFAIKVSGPLLYGALDATANLTGTDFFNTGSMNLDLTLNPGIFLQIRDYVTNYIRDEGGVVAGEIVNTVLPQFKINNIRLASGLNDLNTTMLFKVDFVAGMFGLEEPFSTEVSLQLNLTDVSQVLEELAVAIGNELLASFDYLGLGEAWEATEYVATEAYEFMEESFTVFSSEVEKGFEALGDEIVSWFEPRQFASAISAGSESIVAAGYRHFYVTVDRLEIVSTDDCFGCGGDDVYGQISIWSSGNTYYSNGTNANFFGVSEDGDEEFNAGGNWSIRNTKHVYAKYGAPATIQIQAQLWEDDGSSADDDLVGGPVNVDLGNFYTDISSYFDCTEGDSRWRVHYSVTADPMMTTELLMEAVQQKNIELLKERIRMGGDIRLTGASAMNIAVNNKDKQIVALLHSYGFKTTTENLHTAGQGAYDDQFVFQIMEMGAKPDGLDLNLAIVNKKEWLASAMLERGATPTSANLKTALQNQSYKLAQEILAKGIKPDAQDVTDALNRKDVKSMELLLLASAPVTTQHLTLAITNQLWKVADDLLLRVNPEQMAFTKCAELNNTKMFSSLCAKGQNVSKIEAATIAISKKNMEILDLCFRNGTKGQDVINEAIRSGNFEIIEKALQYGANGNAVVGLAVEKGNFDFYKKLLIEYGVNGDEALKLAFAANKREYVEAALSIANANPNTYLKQSADAYNWDYVNLFLVHGGNPNLAMNGAVNQTNVEMVGKLIGLGADARNPAYMVTATSNNSTPLTSLLLQNGADPNPGMQNAVTKSNYESVKLLLEYGADTKTYIETPASKGNLPMVELFLAFNADPNNGMLGAVNGSYIEIVELLLVSGAKPGGYMSIPAGKGNLGIVKLLVDYGADPNEGLLSSVENNYFEIAQFLIIDNGAVPKNLVAAASTNRNKDMVILLCDYGDNPEPGVLPAVENADMSIIVLLIEKYQVDPKKQSYLVRAVDLTEEGSHAKIATYFLSKGSDPNQYVENKTENSLLHIVCDVGRKRNRDYDMMVALINGGANLEARNEDGWTPLHMAANRGRKFLEGIKVLVEAGADINACTDKGKSVHKIAEGGDVIDYLESKGAIKKSCEDN